MQIYFNPLDIACKSKVGGVLRKEKIQFNFLKLLNSNKLGFEETNILSEAIESIAPQYDIKLDDSVSKQIKLYQELKNKIGGTIC